MQSSTIIKLISRIPTSTTVLLLLIAIYGCEQTKENPQSPRIKKVTKVSTPAINERFTINDRISFVVESQSDTVQISRNILMMGVDTLAQSTERLIEWEAANFTGIPSLRIITVLSNGAVETHTPKIVIHATPPEQYTYRLVNTFPHDPDAYTQGLIYFRGQLYESTGQRGESDLRLVEIATGKTLKSINLADQYFGEGLTMYGDHLYQLTWTSNTCFVYDMATFEQLKTFTYPTEGWGLTTINDELVMSDGSEYLFFRSPDTFEELRKIQVYDDKGPVKQLNELEYVNGLVYANIYGTEAIVAIDPYSGAVKGKLSLEGIFNKKNYNRRIDVLNGIAYNSDSRTFYVTGKYWPKLFEIEIIKKENL